MVSAVLGSGLAASRAEAHAILKESNPSDGEIVDEVPDEVLLRFDAPVQVIDGGLEVYDPSGRRVDNDQESAEGGLVVRTRLDRAEVGAGHGTYTVAWRAVSEDSHNLEGSFVFHVGEETGSVGPGRHSDSGSAFARWLGTFAGLAGLLVGLGASLVAWAAPSALRSALGRVVLLACLVSATGWFVALVGYSATLSGRSIDRLAAESVIGIIEETRAGQLFALRVALMTLAALMVFVGERSERRQLWLLPLLLSTGTAIVTALAGHAWAASPKPVALLADLMHLAAAGIWIGGLVGLLVIVRRTTDPAMVQWFSRVAIWVAGIVAATGIISAFVELSMLEAVWSTTYGRLVLGKASGFALLVAFGWWNRRMISDWAQAGAHRFGRSLAGELLVAVLVVGVTAGLVGTSPPKGTDEAIPLAIRTASDGATLDVVVDPGAVGGNNLHLYFSASDGSPLLADAVEVTVESATIPARRLDVVPIASNHVSVVGFSIPSPDTWTFIVTTISEGTPYVFEFETEIS